MEGDTAVESAPAPCARGKGEAGIKKEFMRPVRSYASRTVSAPAPPAEAAKGNDAASEASTTASAASADSANTTTGDVAEAATGVAEKRPASESAEADAPPAKRKRGMNKSRKPTVNRLPMAQRLCSQVARSEDCTYGEKCRFSHNIAAFLAAKPKDLEGECVIFSETGKCPHGVMCRFAGKHLSASNENVTNLDVANSYHPTTVNFLSKELQTELRQRSYDFSRTDAISRDLDRLCGVSKDGTQKQSGGGNDAVPASSASVAEASAAAVAAPTKTLGAVTDLDQIRLRPQEKKIIDFSDKLYLAPLTTVGNLPFRRICKRYGVDITCGEMALATQLLQGQTSEWALVRRHECEDIFGVQIAGSFPDTMTRCVQVLQERCELDFIDINVGCPIDLVFKKGAGCALMGRQTRFERVVRSVSAAMDIPLTVKMRTGVYDRKYNAHELIPKLYDWGASLVTVHGRSREQRYTRSADWDYLSKCASAADGRYFYGNGDILSYEDFENHRNITGLSGVMLARGALIKPWLFTEIKEKRHWDISSSERFDILRDFSKYGLAHWGSDSKGVETTRRFLLEWLSFLHRYIPVGILETLPQRINERPAPYFGRDDMETLLASDNCQDWVKISEMLLGPVADGFSFLPKHRANSYQAPSQ
ncbi:tRNA-dihydrouridine(47) synthase [NAD(P)(+)]-like [Sycon ciliatum]|uniref:tRNA-dihydrouridine(47) synthase [NAD(P)(+)]-like n=1 Tax=Sycon ciliatum TaxID=27933 RepID=UPI0031F5FC3F